MKMTKTRFAAVVLSILVIAGIVRLNSGEQPDSPPSAAADTLRSTSYGPVVGFYGANGGHAWLGIHYAKAPVNELRWKAPGPPEIWSEALQTTACHGCVPNYHAPVHLTIMKRA